MNQQKKLRFLSIALYVFGAIFMAGIFLMMKLWPGGWGWTPSQPEYEWMLIGIYATLGFFLIRAAQNPLEHLSLIQFTIWSSIVHGGIMLVQALMDQTERINLLGDIPALFLVAAILWYLTPPKNKEPKIA